MNEVVKRRQDIIEEYRHKSPIAHFTLAEGSRIELMGVSYDGDKKCAITRDVFRRKVKGYHVNTLYLSKKDGYYYLRDMCRYYLNQFVN